MKKLSIFWMIWQISLYAGGYGIPKALELDGVNAKVFSDVSWGSKHLFVKDTFYMLGYSGDKIAYLIKHDNDPADIFSVSFIVQDLVSDKRVFVDKFEIDDMDGSYTFSRYWQEKRALITRTLQRFEIVRSRADFHSSSIAYQGDSYTLHHKESKIYDRNSQLDFLTYSQIIIRSKNKGQKVIDKNRYRFPSYILTQRPIGFLKLGNGKRAATLIGRVIRGWEGPPHNLHYRIVGAHLYKGYK